MIESRKNFLPRRRIGSRDVSQAQSFPTLSNGAAIPPERRYSSPVKSRRITAILKNSTPRKTIQIPFRSSPFHTIALGSSRNVVRRKTAFTGARTEESKLEIVHRKGTASNESTQDDRLDSLRRWTSSEDITTKNCEDFDRVDALAGQAFGFWQKIEVDSGDGFAAISRRHPETLSRPCNTTFDLWEASAILAGSIRTKVRISHFNFVCNSHQISSALTRFERRSPPFPRLLFLLWTRLAWETRRRLRRLPRHRHNSELPSSRLVHFRHENLNIPRVWWPRRPGFFPEEKYSVDLPIKFGRPLRDLQNVPQTSLARTYSKTNTSSSGHEFSRLTCRIISLHIPRFFKEEALRSQDHVCNLKTRDGINGDVVALWNSRGYRISV
ncbi:hypothetical protein BDZ89DRAFT_1237578 [Hymenopellis radicata]|nr:hypothetical protein BDZ89DRAFT_1237578 [Hymenopellis radicata]